MPLTSGTGCEIRKFDNKDFALWKEMLQDVLIIRRQIEAIWHNNKPTTMTEDEWQSLDEIVQSAIWMRLAENVYFSRNMETIVYALWEKLHSVYDDEGDRTSNLPYQHLYSGINRTHLTGP